MPRITAQLINDLSVREVEELFSNRSDIDQGVFCHLESDTRAGVRRIAARLRRSEQRSASEEARVKRMMIFENPRFGRVLALDGIVQTTEGDEFAYHEMLAHVPILAHGEAKRVAIVGGGDGGALEEVLKHDVERAVLIEIDPGVVALSKRFLPSICGNAFEDPRAEVVYADGIQFMKTTDETFDVIIIDSTDPIGPSIALFEQALSEGGADSLDEGGVQRLLIAIGMRLYGAIPAGDLIPAIMTLRARDIDAGTQASERAVAPDGARR